MFRQNAYPPGTAFGFISYSGIKVACGRRRAITVAVAILAVYL